MIWFYVREADALRLDTMYDSDTAEYVLRFTDPSLGPIVERFPDRHTYHARLVTLEAELEAAAWRLTGMPHIIPEGFPRTPPIR